MPGPLLHLGATVTCAHLGQAQPTSVNARVLVSGQPIATMTSTYSIMGCTFPSISVGAPPCATAQWVRGATRVLAGGVPVLLMDSQAVCVPTGTPLIPVAAQPRVVGT
jgi:uncharacterized Zn-binding protein involved in type VI secretion